MSHFQFDENRIAVLRHYEHLCDQFHKCEYLLENNPDPKNHQLLADAYEESGIKAMLYREEKGITKQEFNAWKKRDTVTCKSIAEDLSALAPTAGVH